MNETGEWLYDIDSGMLVSVQQSVQTALPTHTHAHHRAEGDPDAQLNYKRTLNLDSTHMHRLPNKWTTNLQATPIHN
ncbi:3-demethylubiquinone-9 3-methyltransferase [Operophtera brumata]|uniref:3-demethylubiquinone-9 3-methyltransferase n=1 Tax=Operophtera brumata TaxID=104452 RepID=A0A0L7LA45_OPEBR|nr:3-demethylubiquinone-9 3-methyltransferase [Operophtera brumata]